MAGAVSPSPKDAEKKLKQEPQQVVNRKVARMVRAMRQNPALQIMQNTMALEAMKKEAGIEEDEEPNVEALEVKVEKQRAADNDNLNKEPAYVLNPAEDAIREVIAQRQRDREAREARLQAPVNPAAGPEPEPAANVTVTRSGRVVKPSLKARERMESEGGRKGKRRSE